ncbi:MvdC/MvdD family ATP grasp protein [Candidatus Uabimicrobium sp. HlEnr_7]|uniref:MvdC/MvdD family ATP grasp protein n=1 Tax=Candidatus Uabimicrobium helgolandensis TaxID=3095367 RepID=UPI003557D089
MKKPNILIISPHDDGHTAVVQAQIKKIDPNIEVCIFATQDFPQKMEISTSVSNEDVQSIITTESETISCENIKSVWFRRPRKPVPSPDVTDSKSIDYIEMECDHAVYGFWQTLDCLWINPPSLNRVAHRKVFQLQEAQKIGLAVPDTLFTNSPEKAHEFYEKHNKKIIYKTLSSKPGLTFTTKMLTEKDLEFLKQVKLAPVTFQEFIPANYDLRITIIDNKVFSAKIKSQESKCDLDWRNDLDIPMEVYNLPEEVERKLLALTNKLGLVYSAIDLRVTPENEYVFLEVNVGGQFLFVEINTDLPISKTLAELLIRGKKFSDI